MKKENEEPEEQEIDEPIIEEPAVEEEDPIAAAQAETEEWKDKYLRLSAEFDNFRKRTLKEKAELILNGGEKTIISLLPVIDDLERALGTMTDATDVAAIREGIDLICQKFLKTLAEHGVSPIDTLQQELNTDYHEAIALVPAPTEDAQGKIMDCVEKGYLMGDKVIRHAKVVVGQ
jgi:molecular chaperone GrpE